MTVKYDILIKDTLIIDGTGKPGYLGDIGIIGEKIASVGKVEGSAEKIIDGRGLITCPGFIDAHDHADLSILQYPNADNFIVQGITTVVGGHCGLTLAPVLDKEYVKSMIDTRGCGFDIVWNSFNEFLDHVEQFGITPNYIPLAGHNAIRGSVLGGYYTRKSTPVEIEKMKEMLTEALESGCFGMSVGLDGAMPGHFADINEIVDLVKIVKKYDGIFAPHTRHHQNQWPAEEPGESAYGIFDAPAGEIITGRYHGLLEAVEISRMSGNARLHISHMTPAYIIPQPHPASLDEELAKATIEDIIEKAEKNGIDISYNVIPSGSSISGKQLIRQAFFSKTHNLPKWLREMKPETFIHNLNDHDFRKKVKSCMLSGKMKLFMIHPLTDPYWADDYMILNCKNKSYEGKTLWEIARQREPNYTIKAVYDDSFDVLFDILQEDPDATWTLIKDKREYGSYHIFLKHRLGIPCTDIYSKPAEQTQEGRMSYNYGLSPTEYNMFPMYLQKMVKEMKLLKIEEAIYKITGFPASKLFKLNDRGIIKEDSYADIVIMDFDNMIVNTDFNNPEVPTKGIDYVIVNGCIAYEHGELTRKKNGKVIRKK
jgi:N-acyl-D-amino-acid deacylase